MKERSRKLDRKYEDLVLMACFLREAIPERRSPYFAGHDVHLETERLLLRPFQDADYDIALPFYQDREFRDLMEGDPDATITRHYLERAGDHMSRCGYYFAIVDKSTGRPIGELCLQWMNLSRANVRSGEKVMRTPIGIWNKSLWRKGYGRETLNCIMGYAFETVGIDRLCAMDVKPQNFRSRGLFQSCGFHLVREMDNGSLDFEITRGEYRKDKH